MRCIHFALGVFVAAVGCGGDVFGPTGDGGGDTQNGDGGPGPGPDCPSSVPNDGTACMANGVSCEYGGDPRWTCNNVATCANNVWSVATSDKTTCPTTNVLGCPASESSIQPGMACMPLGLSCNYSNASATSFCACIYLGGPIHVDGGNGAQWQCTNLLAGCPAERPRLGSSCTSAALDCDYAVCGAPSGLSVQCDGTTNTWVEGSPSACAQGN
jgi:hypothetical protein